MVAAGTLFAVVAMTSASCNPEPPPKPTSNWTIERARTFQEFPLYWLGDSYQGAPLTSIRLTTDGDGVTHASFSYGEPTYAGDAASGSWLAPLEVDIQPYCGFSPEEFLSFEDDYGTDPIAVEVRTVNG